MLIIYKFNYRLVPTNEACKENLRNFYASCFRARKMNILGHFYLKTLLLKTIW